MEVGVLFSSGGILALNKPAGMISQGPKTSDIPELWELLRTRYPSGHVAHRIDQFTSGVNLAGVSRSQLRYLQSNWHQITRKAYLMDSRLSEIRNTTVLRQKRVPVNCFMRGVWRFNYRTILANPANG